MSAIDFTGTWKMDRGENIEEWLKTLDVNMVKRKAMCVAKPTQIIKQVGDTFEVTMLGPMDKVMHEETFQLGKEFTTTLPFGLKINATANWDGDKLVVNATSDDPKHKLTMTREMVGDELVVTSNADGTICKRFFKK